MSDAHLSERLTIQAPTETADSQGGAAVAWTTLASRLPAELLEPRTSGERTQGEAMGSLVQHTFRLRVRGDVTPAMRVVWTPNRGWPASRPSQTLEILHVRPAADRFYMLLDCGVRQ